MTDRTRPQSPPPRPVVAPRREPASVPVWVLGFLAALFFVTCLSVWAVVAVTRPTSPRATASAVFVVLTKSLEATAAVGETQSSAAEPTGTVPPAVNPGSINLGSYVQIVRTDGDPLKLRQAPTLSSEVNYLAVPNEVLRVANGPTIADGFTWWFLVDLTNDARNGWAVENYLDATNAP